MLNFFKKSQSALLLFVIISSGMIACKEDKNAAPAATAAAAPAQIPTVKVMTLQKANTTLKSTFPASIEGINDVEMRPKIDGYLETINVEEGQLIGKGTLMFTINNPQFEQDIRNAEASVKVAQADIEVAKLNVEKTQPLVDKKIISDFDLQSAQINLKTKEAALLKAQAVLDNAKTNLGYTRIYAPVSGIVGKINLKKGAYVNSGIGAITTLSDVSKVFAYFSLSEKYMLSYLNKANVSDYNQAIKSMPELTLELANGEVYEHKGKVESLSAQVSKQTGAYNVRATFNNPKGILRTGSNVLVSIISEVNDAIVIPQKVTYEVQGIYFAYVVGADNKLEAVEIKVIEVPGGQDYIVESGLKVGDVVLTEGIGKFKAGDIVQPAQ